MFSLKTRDVFIWGFIFRIALVIYGEWQDAHMELKYTDIDYIVFSDAARFVYEGQSPFMRSTYRYTPLLSAWMMVPNAALHPAFGKVLFCVVDLAIGWLLLRILTRHMRSTYCQTHATFLVGLWLLNPISINVSSRGNAESLVTSLVLVVIYLLLQRKLVPAAVLSVVWACGTLQDLPDPLCAAHHPAAGARILQGEKHPGGGEGQRHRWQGLPVWYEMRHRVWFGLISGSVFLALTAFFYWLYGYTFLYEGYLYHVVRTDPRHNFSVYFYQLYLTHDMPANFVQGLASFLPQLLLLVTLSVCLFRRLPLCLFLLTLSFVIFNKVCTVQYFVWYLSLMPLALPYVAMTWKKAVVLAACWQLAQFLWLGVAYFLEFGGLNTFLPLWVASLCFFVSNAAVMAVFLRCPAKTLPRLD